ncbi:mRNA binding protein puf3 [Serendipita sp. 397]|nr:mRNA binding protein puf3 [Serendipita sp. 397]KAG8801071.1 mRNA binding protein puf3 [Serendipita sp. 398]
MTSHRSLTIPDISFITWPLPLPQAIRLPLLPPSSMADSSSYSMFPLYGRHDAPELAKYSPVSTGKASVYETESPLAAHSSTSTSASSRLSGSYEPSQVESIIDEMGESFAKLQVNNPVAHNNNPHIGSAPAPTSQRPHVPHLILSSTTSNFPQARMGAVQAPYGPQPPHSYYAVATSPVLQDHPAYSYPSIHANIQHRMVPAASYASPVMYSPPPVHAAPYHQMTRRPSISVYHPYDYGGMHSPISPYGYHHPVNPFSYGPPTSPQHYPPQPAVMSPPPVMMSTPPTSVISRQTRPLASSPLRPQQTTASAPLVTTTTAISNQRRRPAPLNNSSASSYNPQSTRRAQGGASKGEQRETNSSSGNSFLADFKNQKFKRFELKDVFGHCVEFSSDQHGSRFIQQKFDTATPEERKAVFDEIVPNGHTLVLMRDVFGNYVIQKLFEYGTPHHKKMLCSVMDGNMLQLSLDMYGCRVVQKAIDCVSPAQQSAIVAELSGHVLQCVKDANGNHVIQKIMERIVSERMVLINAFSGNVRNLASHPYGCRVLQRCFEHASQEETAQLSEELHQNSSALMQDQFGNYVIQFILERGTLASRDRMIDSLKGKFLLMASHKFASNVCEKALVSADTIRRRVLIDEILSPNSSGVTAASLMMCDQFANYVLQKAISLADADQLASLVAIVLPQLVTMRRNASTTSSKQLANIERLLKEKGFVVAGDSSGSPTP